jgi:hypothetical protein
MLPSQSTKWPSRLYKIASNEPIKAVQTIMPKMSGRKPLVQRQMKVLKCLGKDLFSCSG